MKSKSFNFRTDTKSFNYTLHIWEVQSQNKSEKKVGMTEINQQPEASVWWPTLPTKDED